MGGRTTQKNSLCFCFRTILFFLIITLALDRLIAHIEPPLGSVLSPATLTPVQSWSMGAVGGIL